MTVRPAPVRHIRRRHLNGRRALSLFAPGALLLAMVACSDSPRLVDTGDVSAGDTTGATAGDAGEPSGQTPGGAPGGETAGSTNGSATGTADGNTDGAAPAPAPGSQEPIDSTPGEPAPVDGRGDEEETLPPPAERVSLYLGTVGTSTGTWVVDAQGIATGLLPGADGTSRVVVGALGGETLDVHQHDAGIASFAPAPWPFGSPANALPAALSVDDGVGITGEIDGEAVSLVAVDGEVAAPSSERLNGNWQLAQGFCDSDDEGCSTIVATLTLNNGAISGSTGIITDGGDDLYPSDLQGTLTRLGDASAAQFIWNTYRYNGMLHFVPGESDRLVLLGTTPSEVADYPSLVWLLTRLP